MKRTLGYVALALAFGLLSPLASAQTQTPPAAPSADDPAMNLQRTCKRLNVNLAQVKRPLPKQT